MHDPPPTREVPLRVVAHVMILLALVGCGGPPPAPLAPVAAPPPWQPPALHPADGVGVVRLIPAEAAAWVQRLAGAHRLLAGAADRATALRAVPWAALGLDPARPLTLSARSAPAGAVARALEDVGRVVADPPAGGLPAWLATHPLPPTWLHLRVVGAGTPVPADADARLGACLGGLQRFALTEAPEVTAAGLEASVGDLAALAPLGGSRFYKVLELDLPVLIRVEPGPITVVDVLVDLTLGDGALMDGLRALPELQATPRFAPALPIRAPGEWARGGLDLAAWRRLVSTAEHAAALWTVLGDNPLRLEPAVALGLAQVAAERRLSPLALAGAGGRIEVLGAGDTLTLEGEPVAALAALRSERALPFERLAEVAPAVVDWRPPAVAPALPEPPAPWPELVARFMGCGLPCAPAVWPALAHAAGDPRGLAAALAPEGHPMRGALSELRTAAFGGADGVTLTVLGVRTQAPSLAQVVGEVGARVPVAGGEVWIQHQGGSPQALAQAVAWGPAAHALRAQARGQTTVTAALAWTPQGQQRVVITARPAPPSSPATPAATP